MVRNSAAPRPQKHVGKSRIAIVGGRGYTGEVLLHLVSKHPSLELAWVSSRSLAGRRIDTVYPAICSELVFEYVSPDAAARRRTDVLVLALPNGVAGSYVTQLPPEQRVLDLSADFRFDDSWTYGLPELYREQIRGAVKVSNPGCYATAVQLALAPLVTRLHETPSAFGVSGFSGAGRTPSARNDPQRLANNLQPYSLSGHLHESEVSRYLCRDVRFLPHVADFFRGISVTVSAVLKKETCAEELLQTFKSRYARERLVELSDGIPEVRDVVGKPFALVGGFTVDQRNRTRISLVACIDNLLKGAASQAVQNINLMLGMQEFAGLLENAGGDNIRHMSSDVQFENQ